MSQLKNCFLIIIILKLQVSTTDFCLNGCLRCLKTVGEEFVCQICDIQSYFTRQGYKCQTNKIENCEKTIDGINCKVCITGFILQDGKCIDVETKIENCKYQSSVNECQECDTGKYYDSNTKQCLDITKDIPNCKIFDQSTSCKICDKSSLNQTKTQCLPMKNFDNCDYFTAELACTKCIDGYSYFQNKYLNDMKEDSVYIRSFYLEQVINKVDYINTFTKATNVCEKKIDNCIKEGKFHYLCEQCAEGYFLIGNFCYKNPESRITNCILYEQVQENSNNVVQCKQCNEGFYLSPDKKNCIQHQELDRCIKYDAIIANKCIQCESLYFLTLTLDNEQICQKRQQFTNFCLIYKNDTENTCTQCQDGYYLTPNAKCLQFINNCIEHLPVQNTNDQGTFETLICKNCLAGFYVKTIIKGELIETTCELPEKLIEGCNKYQTDTQCIECEQNYYLQNFSCHPMDDSILQNLHCEQLSLTDKNDCSVCKESQYLFKLYNYCKPIPQESLISDCFIFALQSDGQILCQQCNSGFYYDATQKKCIQAIFQDCTEMAKFNRKCINCDLNKSLIPNNNNDDNKCVKIPDVLYNNCKNFEFKLDGTQTVGCKSCGAGYYPRLFDSQYYSFCILENQLREFRSALTETNKFNLDNCLSFQFDSSDKQCMFCDQSKEKKFISGSYCKDSCASDEIAIVFYFETQTTQPTAFMKCIRNNQINMLAGVSFDNCKIIDFDISRTLTTVKENEIPKGCIECLDGYKGFINDPNDYFYNHYVQLPYRYISSSSIKGQYFYSVWNKNLIFTKCVKFNATMETTTNKLMTFELIENVDFPSFKDGFEYLNILTFESVTNLEGYFTYPKTISQVVEGGITYNTIQTCSFGTTGVIVQKTVNTAQYDFVLRCVIMEGCDSNIFYTGICNQDKNCRLEYHLSCSQCLDLQKIPTVPYTIKMWSIPDISNIDPTSLDEGDVTSIAEKGPFKTIAKIKENNEKVNLATSCEIPGLYKDNLLFPSNCAVQMVLNLLYYYYTPSNANKTPNPICIACYPKYKPTFSTSNANSLNFKYINVCEIITHCKFSIEYNKCQECNTDYVLKYGSEQTNGWKTSGEECVSNNMEGCLVGELNSKCHVCKKGYILNESNVCDKVLSENCTAQGSLIKDNGNSYSYLNSNPFRLGCQQCGDGFLSVTFNFRPEICIENTTLKSTIDSLKVNFKIDNCSSFQFKDSRLVCTVCSLGYYLTSDGFECISEKIANCQLYNKTLTGSYECQTCKEKYYLLNGACLKGEITGCVIYDTKESCVQCEDGYLAIKTNNNQYTLCFYIKNSVKNCEIYDKTEGFNGILKCSQCSSTTYNINFTLVIKTCADFPKINFCDVYDLQTTLQTSSFSCSTCQKDYYVVNQFPSICKKRVRYPIYNCIIYALDQDLCSSCNEGFFLSFDKTNCISNPDGIQYCRKYLSYKECSECEAPYIVNINKQCGLVPAENQVLNCYTYSQDLLCSQCIKEYDLSGNNCVKINIPNCVNIGFHKECIKCSDGYKFFKPNCDKTNVTNCIEFQDANTCTKCEKQFKLVSGRCFEATLISGCELYGENDNCLQCESGKILENNGTKCSTLTENEVTLYQNNTCHQYERINTCFVCKQGYYFLDGVCTAIGPSGCAYIDPQDTNKCLICQQGKYMNQEGNCIDNKIIETSTGEVVEKKSDYYMERFLKRIMSRIILVVIFVI